MDRMPDFKEALKKIGLPCTTRTRRYTPFETTSLVAKIKKMKLYLMKVGHEYLDTYGHLPKRMSDEERQELDDKVEVFIDNCEENIKILRSEIKLDTNSEQVIEHRETMIKLVRRILNDLFKHFNHLKTTRIRRQVEKDRFDRLVSEHGSLDPGDEFASINTSNLDFEKLTSLSQEETLGTSLSSIKHSQPSHKANKFDDHPMIEDEHQDLSPREMQALVRENSRIHEELITFDDEVRLIGKKVAQISKLQELFTEKVMEQAVDLNNLHETAIRSSENVREGNDLIRDAMMKNASTRVFILFYIITLGFTILFLDWYNP